MKLDSTLSNKYFVAHYKSDGKDLDEMINAGEVDRLEDVFETKTLFQYSIEYLISSENDDEFIIETVMPSILQEESPIKRSELAKQLAEYTDTFSADTIMREVNYREDIEKRGIIKKYDRIFDKYKNAVAMDPKNIGVLMEHLKEDTERIHEEVYTKDGNIFDKTLDALREFEEEAADENSTIKTGFDVFDQTRLLSPNFIAILGRANSFKTTLFENLAVNIIENNRDICLFFYSTDDTKNKIFNDLVANISGLPRDYVYNPLKHPEYGLETSNRPEAMDIYNNYLRAIKKIEGWIRDKKLIVQHHNDLATWNSFESAMKKVDEDKDLKGVFKVAIIDSVNKIECGISEGNPRIEFLSEAIKKASERYNFCTFANIELKKIPNKVKIGMEHIRGSIRVEYDCNAIISGNNSQHNLQGVSALEFTNDFGVKCPIIMLELEKSKLGGTKYKRHFYKLDGTINKVTEIKDGTIEYQQADAIWLDEEKRYLNLGAGGDSGGW